MEKAGMHEGSTADSEIISQLKEKYPTAQRSEKIQILTVLPRSWSIRRTEIEFGATHSMVRLAKKTSGRKGSHEHS